MKILILALSLGLGIAPQRAAADTFSKNLVCYGPDNLSIELTADEGWLRVTIEGEGGWAKVFKKQKGNDGSLTYVSTKGVLVLKKGKSTFTWRGDRQPQPLRCPKK